VTDVPPQNSSSGEAVRDVEVTNQFGIHARPAALLVKTASAFQSEVMIAKDGVEVSAKSIMGILTIEGYQGAKIRISARGPDAGQAVGALSDLFEKKFYED